MYNWLMKIDPKLVPISKAILEWREKQPSITKKTVLAWISDGLIEEVIKKHGFLNWHFIPRKEVDRVFKALPTEWKQGQVMLPRPTK